MKKTWKAHAAAAAAGLGTLLQQFIAGNFDPNAIDGSVIEGVVTSLALAGVGWVAVYMAPKNA